MRTNHHPFGPICIDRRFQAGFTLVELMVVVGIISLLIAIVLPAVNAARDQAKVATTRAMISVLETGVEQFRADHLVGGDYPDSSMSVTPGEPPTATMSPHDNEPRPIFGVSFVVWALAGADLLGTPGFRDLNGSGTWRDDTGNQLDPNTGQPQLYYINPTTNKPALPRSGPFVDIDKMKFPESASDGTFTTFTIPSAVDPTKNSLFSLCFLDSFDQPILYYKANPAASEMVARGIGESGEPPGIYNLGDNGKITGCDAPGVSLGAGPEHPMGLLGNWDRLTPPGRPDALPPEPRGSLAYQLHNPNVGAAWRPHRSDSFILISPGPDALYGTADDVANFEINK